MTNVILPAAHVFHGTEGEHTTTVSFVRSPATRVLGTARKCENAFALLASLHPLAVVAGFVGGHKGTTAKPLVVVPVSVVNAAVALDHLALSGSSVVRPATLVGCSVGPAHHPAAVLAALFELARVHKGVVHLQRARAVEEAIHELALVHELVVGTGHQPSLPVFAVVLPLAVVHRTVLALEAALSIAKATLPLAVVHAEHVLELTSALKDALFEGATVHDRLGLEHELALATHQIFLPLAHVDVVVGPRELADPFPSPVHPLTLVLAAHRREVALAVRLVLHPLAFVHRTVLVVHHTVTVNLAVVHVAGVLVAVVHHEHTLTTRQATLPLTFPGAKIHLMFKTTHDLTIHCCQKALTISKCLHSRRTGCDPCLLLRNGLSFHQERVRWMNNS
mmetsp:Transcript_20382/g.51665  ORF Transcript_20382/g.51665 Transcript_20382/m.51665 type:complete len:393 (+) Transcript_20382:1662-2840(+)